MKEGTQNSSSCLGNYFFQNVIRFQVYKKIGKGICRAWCYLGLTVADLRPPMPWAPVSWVMVTRSIGPAIRMLSRGLYLLLRLPVLIREFGDPEFLSSRDPSPIELLPRRGTSGVTGKNPSSRPSSPVPKDDRFGSKSLKRELLLFGEKSSYTDSICLDTNCTDDLIKGLCINRVKGLKLKEKSPASFLLSNKIFYKRF